MIAPTVHLNGTSKADLLAGYRKALDAFEVLIDAMKEIAPNGRDYYPQSPEAIYEAMEDHTYRFVQIRHIKSQIEAIAKKVSEQ
jgi:hypothetical protein